MKDYGFNVWKVIGNIWENPELLAWTEEENKGWFAADEIVEKAIDTRI